MAHSRTPHPFVAFLLVASFGILFAGCGGEKTVDDIPQADEFTFTVDDLARMKELAGNSTGAFIPRLELAPLEEGEDTAPVIDIGTIEKFGSMRKASDGDQDLFRVTNIFLNVRSQPKVTATQVGVLEKGDTLEVVEFENAAWAKVRFGKDEEGFVASRYISKLVTEDEFAAQRKKYDGLYFVDFAFLNVRKEADTNSEKLGELPGQSFVRPLSQDDTWARIPFGEGNGYVVTQYLTPFLPNFLVRQSTFTLPVLHYRLAGEGVLDAMPEHIAALRQEGYAFMTMRQFYQLLLRQEEKDVRLDPKKIIVAVSDITPDNISALSDALRTSSVDATLFLQAQYLGAGIDQKRIQTLLANGHDVQSAGHTGDDLRSLTNAQVELELSQSKQLLERMTKREVIGVAYPLGGVNDRIARKAGEVGYLVGLSTAPDIVFERTQLLRMPSVVVKASATSQEIVSLVKGE